MEDVKMIRASKLICGQIAAQDLISQAIISYVDDAITILNDPSQVELKADYVLLMRSALGLDKRGTADAFRINLHELNWDSLDSAMDSAAPMLPTATRVETPPTDDEEDLATLIKEASLKQQTAELDYQAASHASRIVSSSVCGDALCDPLKGESKKLFLSIQKEEEKLINRYNAAKNIMEFSPRNPVGPSEVNKGVAEIEQVTHAYKELEKKWKKLREAIKASRLQNPQDSAQNKGKKKNGQKASRHLALPVAALDQLKVTPSAQALKAVVANEHKEEGEAAGGAGGGNVTGVPQEHFSDATAFRAFLENTYEAEVTELSDDEYSLFKAVAIGLIMYESDEVSSSLRATQLSIQAQKYLEGSKEDKSIVPGGKLPSTRDHGSETTLRAMAEELKRSIIVLHPSDSRDSLKVKFSDTIYGGRDTSAIETAIYVICYGGNRYDAIMIPSDSLRDEIKHRLFEENTAAAPSEGEVAARVDQSVPAPAAAP
ncbi:MAG: hypothetical protein NTV32_05055, partial [Gammaproteobacteria bacterium]|nr:hypothetical protein [Gammaproteobacteria bacterium]